MPHALALAITERMDELGLRQRDVVESSKLSRALVSKWVTDRREKLTRLPDKETLVGLARGLRLPSNYLLAKSIESLGIGYVAGDFVNAVDSASNVDLLHELAKRLEERDAAGDSRVVHLQPLPDLADRDAVDEWLQEPAANETDPGQQPPGAPEDEE